MLLLLKMERERKKKGHKDGIVYWKQGGGARGGGLPGWEMGRWLLFQAKLDKGLMPCCARYKPSHGFS